ncbi:B- and T-lymphocyte attenuator [Latimeria chalumnae]|uniref:B- and T-lymphocyte attenuator n=1 Tax=Latimeria chalumnae TaxID=7897 RepID=UPI0006D92FDE|nr:PREDICTED: B- and T-lymphocyte attenuator [Latimeria chalumnae]|eukprot:XP_014350589.1 PREDICTED: B- and T-lymphocyte attenuator [Latimeria chalumnae]
MILKRRRVLYAISILTFLYTQVQGTEDLCFTSIIIPRNREVQVTERGSVTLSCTVKYCTEQPSITWCKLNGDTCLPLLNQTEVTTGWIQLDLKSGTSTLSFSAVSTNHSGHYRCEAKDGKQSSASHYITLNVSDQKVSSTTLHPTETTSSQPESLLYSDEFFYGLIALGILILLVSVFIIFILCQRECKVKQKSQEALKMKRNQPNRRSSRHLHNNVAARQHAQQDNVVPSPVNDPAFESQDVTIYDNDPAPKSRMTLTTDQGDNDEIYANSDLADEQDTLVYAFLNHENNQHNTQLTSSTDNFTEYAAVNVKHS